MKYIHSLTSESYNTAVLNLFRWRTTKFNVTISVCAIKIKKKLNLEIVVNDVDGLYNVATKCCALENIVHV